MRSAAAEFSEFLEQFTLSGPAIPVISNVTARPYDAGDVRGTLAQQIDNSVRWLDSVIYLADHVGTRFEEVGPGNVLTKLVGQILKKR